MLSFCGLKLELFQLTTGLTEAFLDALVVIEGHILPNFRDLAFRGGLPSLFWWVDVVHNLHVTEAFDGSRRVHTNLAAAVMLDGLGVSWYHLHFD